MPGIIFIDRSHVRQPWLIRRRFTAAVTGMLAVAAVPSERRARGQVAQNATPDGAGGPTGGPESLITLLSGVPKRLNASGDAGISFFYADLARQFASLGIDQEESFTNTFLEATENPAIFQGAMSPLATASDAFTNAMSDDYTAFIGFQPFMVGQCLLAGPPPDQLSLFQGGIDLDALPDAWEASGYERKSAENGAEIWSIGEEGQVDTSRDPFVSPAFNNATVLDSGIVMFGQMFDTVAEAAHLVTSGGESLRHDPSIEAAVTAMPGTTVSAIGVAPEYLNFASPRVAGERQEGVRAELEENGDQISEMPVWSGMMAGITGGFTNPSTDAGRPRITGEGHAPGDSPADRAIVVRLVTGSEDDAATAADIVEQRWTSWTSAVSNRPFTELMTIRDSGSAGPVATLDFTPVSMPSVWIDLVLQRDLLPFASAVSTGDSEATPAG